MCEVQGEACAFWKFKAKHVLFGSSRQIMCFLEVLGEACPFCEVQGKACAFREVQGFLKQPVV